MTAPSLLRFGAWLNPLLLAVVIIALVDTAEAARGVVVYKRGSCDYGIVNARTGFALLEWYGGNDLSEGDELAGNLASYGMKTLRNVTADSDTIVWVEEYGPSRSRAIERYGSYCLYQARVKESPPTAEGLYVASSLAVRLGHRRDQEAALRRLQKDFPEHRLARHAALELARAAFIRNEWKDAEVLARDAAQSDDVKVRTEAWLLVGEAELTLKRFPEAVKSFESVGAAESVDRWIRYRALAGRGLAHEHLQQFRLALSAYESVASSSPGTALRNWAQERLKIVKARLTSAP